MLIFPQSQPKPNSYFRNRFSRGKATTPSHTQAIFTGCLSLASLSLASFLLLAGRLLWRFLKKQREKGIQETQSMEKGMEEKTDVSFVLINLFPPNLNLGSHWWRDQTLKHCCSAAHPPSHGTGWQPLWMASQQQRMLKQLYSCVSQYKAVATSSQKGP